MSLVLKELVSSEATNRRNAAFCVGELCKNGGESALKYPFSCYPFDSCALIFLLFFWVSLWECNLYDYLCQSILVVCPVFGVEFCPYITCIYLDLAFSLTQYQIL